METCIPLLQKNRYACFSEASHSIADGVGNKDINYNQVDDIGSDNSNDGDDKMEDQEGELESSDNAWANDQEEGEGYRELGRVQFEGPK